MENSDTLSDTTDNDTGGTENSDTLSDTTDNDTGGTGSAEVFDMHNDEPSVNVEEEEVETDVSFKVCNVNFFAVSRTDRSLLFNLHRQMDMY